MDHPSSFETAYEKLLGHIGSHPLDQLPSMRELAFAWGVSLSQVQKIVGRAVAENFLQTRPGSGVWPRGRLPQSLAPTRSKHTAQQAAERLAEEIRTGIRVSGDPLPSLKELAGHFGIHVATLRKALRTIEREGSVEQHGHKWIVSTPRLRRSSDHRPRLLCIGMADPEGGLRMGTDREWDFWREIQAEASRCGLHPVLRPLLGAHGVEKESSLGAIVSTWHFVDPRPLLDSLRQARLPTAVWVENPATLPGTRYRDASRMWFHDLAYGADSGKVLARHLLERGSLGKIAWIGPFQASQWSRNRMRGFLEALPENAQVHESTASWISEWDVQTSVWSDASLWEAFPLHRVDHRGRTADLVRPFMEAVARDRSLELLDPILQAALDSGARTWVAANDLAATWCLHWLSARNLRVPQDIALAGFDDTREAMRLDLTSVRFDAAAMARAMVRQILTPTAGAPRVTRHSGNVVERGSTLRAPRLSR